MQCKAGSIDILSFIDHFRGIGISTNGSIIRNGCSSTLDRLKKRHRWTALLTSSIADEISRRRTSKQRSNAAGNRSERNEETSGRVSSCSLVSLQEKWSSTVLLSRQLSLPVWYVNLPHKRIITEEVSSVSLKNIVFLSTTFLNSRRFFNHQRCRKLSARSTAFRWGEYR